MKPTTRITLISLAVSLGGFLFGFDASVISGVIKYITPLYDLNEVQLGWVVSSPAFSAMFAMLISGRLSDRYGRKNILIAIAFLYAVSALLSAITPSANLLIVARMLGGIAFGGALVLAPVYIAEIAPPASRGRMVSIQQLNIVLGFSVAYFSNYLLLKNASADDLIFQMDVWRVMLGIEFFPAIIYFALLFFIPKSPRWLYMKGKKDTAKKLLGELFGTEESREQFSAIEQSLTAKGEVKSGIKDLFGNKKLHAILWIAFILGILQQITGINAIFFYATSIFEQTGIGTDASFAQAVLVGIINVIFTVVAMVVIDRFGRRPLLLVGLVGIALSMLITSYGFSKATYTLSLEELTYLTAEEKTQLTVVDGTTYSSDLAFKAVVKEQLSPQVYRAKESELIQSAIQVNPYLILAGILGFVASFALSLGPVMWVLLSEIFPNRFRGIAISVVGFVNSFTSWVIQFVFPIELATLGNTVTYALFAGFAVLGWVYLYRKLPETKGKSLEELEQQFQQ